MEKEELIELFAEATDACETWDCLRTFNDEPFMIFSDWKELEKVNEYLRKHLPPEVLAEINSNNNNENSSGYIDYILNDNWGFADEWNCCDNCGEVFCYNNTDEYAIFNGSIMCKECLNAEEYLESISNNPKQINQIYDDCILIDMGWEKVNESTYENGMYDVCDDPEKILQARLDFDPEGKYIFSIAYSNPFAIYFNLWKKVE